MTRRTAAAAVLSAGSSAVCALLSGCRGVASSGESRGAGAATAAKSGGPATAKTRRSFQPFFQRGMNFTAEHGVMYGSPEANEVLARMKACGVDSIALVPYGFQRRESPSVGFGRGWETDESVTEAAKAAHAAGMRVMLKPQVWVRGGWPGDVQFSEERDRAEWFSSYGTYLDHYAGLAERIQADLFCVGVEFVHMSKHADGWRGLIERARQIYGGPLVYAATQGEEFESIQFWDALDYIGLNEYYPLPDDLSTTGLVSKVEAVQKRFAKPVIFTEGGFTSYKAPHRAPWDETHREFSHDEQARCYEAVLKAFWDKPWFYGVYWWRVGTNGEGGAQDGRHTPWGKPAMEVVEKWYKQKRPG